MQQTIELFVLQFMFVGMSFDEMEEAMSNQNAQSGAFARRIVPAPLVPVHWIETSSTRLLDNPCTVSSLDLQVRVCGLYADVSETIVIKNPNGRDLSVDLAIPLPDQAVVRGYSLDINGQMVDGVVVPKEKARVAFETEQRIGADPGLVESVKGNVYRTRVYPVRARRARTVQLRYVAPLLVVDGQSAFLDLPMPAERLGRRKVRVDVELLDCPAPELSGLNDAQFKELGTFWSVESNEQDVAPGSGIRVALPKLPQSFALVERDESGELWFSASESAPLDVKADAPAISSLTVLWDVSGSRAFVDHAPEIELLNGYAEAGAIESYRLIAFSDHVEPVQAFGSIGELVEHINALRYDGGTNFKDLARAVAELPKVGEEDAYVLFTDGMDTLSNEPVAFPRSLKILAVVSGAQRDAEALRQACGGLVFDLAAAPKGAGEFAKALFCPNHLTGVEGEGIAEFLGIGSGNDGRFSVVGRLVAPSTSITFANTGTTFDLSAESAREGGVISHAWAAMRVAQLSPRADENADELLQLGRRFGVVSPVTSLLVLETLDQWLRYEIEPPLTWESMHRDWERSREGLMWLSSEQELADYHLMGLKRDWADLKEWWARDYSASRSRRSNERRRCETCGFIVEPGSRFCRNCGDYVAVLPREAAFSSASDSFFDEDVIAPTGLPDSAGWGWDSSESVAAEESVSMEEGVHSLHQDSYAAMSMPLCAPASVSHAAETVSRREESFEIDSAPTPASIKVQAWMPNADYLAALDEAVGDGSKATYDVYFQQRPQYAASPSFFVDCAGWFMANGEGAFGLSVLTNLAELRIEDAALLRIMAWRLREAGELERALVVLRRVLKIRPEDSQSHRDMALVLDELARKAYADGDQAAAKAYAEEAGAFYREIALTPWQRRANAIGLFAVEEYNVMRAWAAAQDWEIAPELESLGEELEGVLDCDLRITLAWDADETDVDLHVTEPTGEEAYYGHRFTADGGRVSEDITDGYGPELYEIRQARNGSYAIRAHYYASHQQTVFGSASCTLTVYTDWGRPTQKQQVTSIRLEKEKEFIPVGTATYGDAEADDSQGASGDPDAEERVPYVTKGAIVADLIAVYGEPTDGDPGLTNGELSWSLPDGRTRVATIVDGKADHVVECMPWGIDLVIVQ